MTAWTDQLTRRINSEGDEMEALVRECAVGLTEQDVAPKYRSGESRLAELIVIMANGVLPNAIDDGNFDAELLRVHQEVAAEIPQSMNVNRPFGKRAQQQLLDEAP